MGDTRMKVSPEVLVDLQLTAEDLPGFVLGPSRDQPRKLSKATSEEAQVWFLGRSFYREANHRVAALHVHLHLCSTPSLAGYLCERSFLAADARFRPSDKSWGGWSFGGKCLSFHPNQEARAYKLAFAWGLVEAEVTTIALASMEESRPQPLTEDDLWLAEEVAALLEYKIALHPEVGLTNARVRVLVEGTELECDPPLSILHQTTLAPARPLFEPLGLTVEWQPKERIVILRKGNDHAEVHIGRPEAVINGQKVPLKALPLVYQGEPLVPLEPIAERFHLNLEVHPLVEE